MKRWDYAVGQYPRAETSRCTPRYAPLEDQLHLVRPAEIQVLANDLLKEDAPRLRAVEHLGQRKLRLQDGNVIAIAGLPIRGGERVRQLGQPLAQQRIDLRRRQAVANLLQTLGIGTGENAVVQRLKGDAFLGQLSL